MLPHRVHGMRQNPQPQPVCCDQYRYCLISTIFTDTVYTVQFGKSVPVTGPVVTQRVGRDIALPFHDHGTRSGEWSASRPGRSLPRERAGTHCTRFNWTLTHPKRVGLLLIPVWIYVFPHFWGSTTSIAWSTRLSPSSRILIKGYLPFSIRLPPSIRCVFPNYHY